MKSLSQRESALASPSSEPHLAPSRDSHSAGSGDSPASKRSGGMRVAWGHLGLAALGLAASAYALHVHNVIKAGGDSGCGVSQGISCDRVIGSSWGEFAGIPLGVYGMAFWLVVIITAVSSRAVPPLGAAWQRLGVAGVGLTFSVALAAIAHFVIGAFCPVCAITHGLNAANFALATATLVRIRAASVQE